MHDHRIPFQNPIAVLVGLVLGYLVGWVAFSAESATGALLFVGFIVTPIPVCLIAGRRWVWLSVVPVLASQVTLLTLSYLHSYKPAGTDLQSYLHTRIYPSWWWWLLWWLPAIMAAGIFYAIKSRRIQSA